VREVCRLRRRVTASQKNATALDEGSPLASLLTKQRDRRGRGFGGACGGRPPPGRRSNRPCGRPDRRPIREIDHNGPRPGGIRSQRFSPSTKPVSLSPRRNAATYGALCIRPVIRARQVAAQVADHQHGLLLRASSKRPPDRRSAENPKKRAPPHFDHRRLRLLRLAARSRAGQSRSPVCSLLHCFRDQVGSKIVLPAEIDLPIPGEAALRLPSLAAGATAQRAVGEDRPCARAGRVPVPGAEAAEAAAPSLRPWPPAPRSNRAMADQRLHPLQKPCSIAHGGYDGAAPALSPTGRRDGSLRHPERADLLDLMREGAEKLHLSSKSG
jgi:hypothetical protein